MAATDGETTMTDRLGRQHPRQPSSPLRIGLIAPPWLQVPPPRYGGTESVVDHLARGLQAAGCEVLLAATGDASCPVDRCWILPRALGTDTDRIDGELVHASFAHRELVAAGCDIIHDHTAIGPLWWAARPGPVPVVTTHYGLFDAAAISLYERIAQKVPVIAVSEYQRSTAPTVPIAGVIHHGVDIDRFTDGGGGDHLLFLGRMSPDKGVHRAISAARLAGRRLIIAAKMWDRSERAYFTEMVEPLLGPDVEYVGEVCGVTKRELLGTAAALVNPISWSEPFGLVMIEALASGTPVVAFGVGAAPEIIDHGRNGFLCADEADMADVLTRIDEIDRSVCRSTAVARFSTQRLVADHLRFYPEVIAGGESTIDLRLSFTRPADDARRAALSP
jgi:glycosyltransferase involved in cell wall biosynthesis